MTQVHGYHSHVLETDFMIVKNLLKTYFKVDAAIPALEPNVNVFKFGQIFSMVTRALHAKVVVDLGTGGGYSAGAFASACKETGGVVYTVDLHASKIVRDALDRFTEQEKPVIFIHGDSVEVGKSWDKGDIDILLCDSAHSYGYVLNELTTWNRFHPKVIFVHDTLIGDPRYGVGAIGEPYVAAQEFAGTTGKTFVNLPFATGLGVII